MPRLGALLLVLSVVVSYAGCASTGSAPATQTAPKEPTSLILGRIKIQDGYKDITGTCQATFTDDYGNIKQVVPLDQFGYVFARVTPGNTFLELVSCAEHNASHKSRDLSFEVASPELATYFGHLHFMRTEEAAQKANTAAADQLAGRIIGGLAGGIIIAASVISSNRHSGPPTSINLSERPYDALINYRAQKGELSLPLSYSLAGAALIMPTVALDGEQLSVDAALEDGVALTWSGNSDPAATQLAVRITQLIGGATPLEGCPTLDVSFDKGSVQLPITYHSDAHKRPPRESVQGALDAQTMQAILDAKIVQFKACDLTRRLSFQGTLAGGQLLKAFQARVAKHSKAGDPVAKLGTRTESTTTASATPAAAPLTTEEGSSGAPARAP